MILCPLANLGRPWAGVHGFALTHDGQQEIADRRPAREGRLGRVGNPQPGVIHGVADKRAVGLIASRLKNARGSGFVVFFRQLDFVLPGLARAAHRTQLIDPTQGRLGVGCHQLRANPPHIERAALGFEAGNGVFVEVVAANNERLGKPGLVQDGARLKPELNKIARIQANAGQLVAVVAQPVADPNRVSYPRPAVIGVNQKDAVIGHGTRIGLKGFAFGVKGHDPAMGVGASDRNPQQFSGQHV